MRDFVGLEFRYTSRQFGIWRAILGAYLVFYHLKLLPYAAELWSRAGALPALLPGERSYFPDFLLRMDSPTVAQSVVAGCAVSALFFALGIWRKPAALAFWLLTLWLYNRNPLVDAPEYPFINWLMAASLLIPGGEEFSLSRGRNPTWRMPGAIYLGAWILLAMGYFFAGYNKWVGHDPAWRNGTAMFFVLVTDSARFAWYGNLFNRWPAILFMPLTWGALGSQLCAPLFISTRWTRAIWWVISTSTHLALCFFVNLAQVSVGMFLFHLFLFDQSWLDEASRLRMKLMKIVR